MGFFQPFINRLHLILQCFIVNETTSVKIRHDLTDFEKVCCHVVLYGTLALIPIVLSKLKDGPMPAAALFQALRPSLQEPTDFLSVMDCLFALRAVDLNDKGEVSLCLLN